MQRYIVFTQNALGVFVLFGVIMLAGAATLTLSPISMTPSSGGQTAGIVSEGNEVDPLIKVGDLLGVEFGMDTRLDKVQEGSYNYDIEIQPKDVGSYKYDFIYIDNVSDKDLEVTFEANIANNDRGFFNVDMSDGAQVYRLHDVSTKQAIPAVKTIPAGESVSLYLEYDVVEEMFYPINFLVDIEY